MWSLFTGFYCSISHENENQNVEFRPRKTILYHCIILLRIENESLIVNESDISDKSIANLSQEKLRKFICHCIT